jgi:hypothetical protein
MRLDFQLNENARHTRQQASLAMLHKLTPVNSILEIVNHKTNSEHFMSINIS